jgi:hypothetical protein
MNKIAVERRAIDLSAYKLRSAQESDYDALITESAEIYEDGRLMIVYLELDTDPAPIVEALQRVKYVNDFRTDGLPTNSRTFGFLPRNPLRRDFCTATSLAKENPADHALICDYAERVCDRYYELYNPELYQRHKAATQKHVVGEYRIKQSVFTSGIINYNNPLKYHFDSGNFADVWSNMLVFKHKTSGGYLSVPEYGIGFELKHNSLLMFDGQGLLHGVTPIRKHAPDGFRFSVVYYSLRQMWNCAPLDDELIRIRKVKTERERKRRGKPQ